MTTTVSGSSITFNDNTTQNTSAYGGGFALRNRIINGDFRIDQRNAGASVNNNTTGTQYTLDRWLIYGSQASKFSIQQNAGSVTPPTGYTNYLGATSLSAYTLGASEEFDIIQRIEGYNMSDFGWGTASAKSVTFSFWVRSSLTGTFGGVFGNSGLTRAYPFSYTISSANTWEQKTVTIAGDTSGTWLSTNGIGIQIYFSIGCGTTLQGTPGVWGTTLYLGPTGQTSVVGTNGATFYITGVQLEKGSTATSFDYRPYGQELALCQRYYYKWTNDNAGVVDFCIFQVYASGSAFGKLFDFPVTMRATPTGTASGTFNPYNTTGTAQAAFTSTNVDSLTKQGAGAGGWTGSSGMSAGNATGIRASANAFIAVTAEL